MVLRECPLARHPRVPNYDTFSKGRGGIIFDNKENN
jgi:hypothetical protein